ncbi:hypothetical protein LJC32_01215 [Oscillospiraceae bacterium OttesenSCG-928-F05]|nr:hypothetical protein [Oscillospiraceae bacterium OttesenSCG-928-F05]
MACSVCKSEDVHDDSAILFVDNQGESKVVCRKCETAVQAIIDEENGEEIRKAYDYLSNLFSDITNNEVKYYIANLLENVAQKKQEARQEAKAKEVKASEDIWIRTSKIIAWISFFVIFISGSIIGGYLAAFLSGGDNSGFLGFVFILISFVISLVFISGTMIRLNQARDIRYIRNKLDKS